MSLPNATSTTSSAKYRSKIREMIATFRFVSEGGIETSMIYIHRQNLPYFASYPLYYTNPEILHDWHVQFYDNACVHKLGYVFNTSTWRANSDWESKVGPYDLEETWRRAVEQGMSFRLQCETETSPVLLCGVIGPRRDGYVLLETPSSVEEYKLYHSKQVSAFDRLGVDVIGGFTINHVEEAAGLILAAQACNNVPLILSFTVETNGLLPSGKSLGDTISYLDHFSHHYPLFYMINCAHPQHMKGVFESSSFDVTRLRGFSPNASLKSHAELDASTELDEGVPETLGNELFDTLDKYHVPLPVFVGGCCGTSLAHLHSLACGLTKNTF